MLSSLIFFRTLRGPDFCLSCACMNNLSLLCQASHNISFLQRYAFSAYFPYQDIKNELNIKESLCFIWSLKEFYVSLHRE